MTPDLARLADCPFCFSSKIDPEGWASLKEKGPACDDCGATAETVERWNTRAASLPAGEVREKIARVLYAQEAKRSEHTNAVLSAVTNKKIEGASIEPWDKCKDCFLSDADALIASGLLASKVESEPVVSKPNEIDRRRVGQAYEEANRRFGQWMPQAWLDIFINSYEGKK